MIDVLLVEDDEQKRESLAGFLKEQVGNVSLFVCRSYQSALAQLKTQTFQVVILDMSLPTFDIGSGEDGGRRLPYGGKEILRQIVKRGIVTHVIVVTQFDNFGEGDSIVTRAELDCDLLTVFPGMYVGMVYYSVASGAWKEELLAMVSKVLGE